jgi:hypothetical protein
MQNTQYPQTSRSDVRNYERIITDKQFPQKYTFVFYEKQITSAKSFPDIIQVLLLLQMAIKNQIKISDRPYFGYKSPIHLKT